MSKIEELIAQAKIKELLGGKTEAPIVVETKEKKNICGKIFAVIGVIAAVCGVAYAIYRYLTPDYLEDFEEEDLEEDDADDFEDDFFDETSSDDSEK